MATNEISPLMLRRELAYLLHRSVFEDLNDALAHVHAAEFIGSRGYVMRIRAACGDFVTDLEIPLDDLTASLDHVRERYLRPIATHLMQAVWAKVGD